MARPVSQIFMEELRKALIAQRLHELLVQVSLPAQLPSRKSL